MPFKKFKASRVDYPGNTWIGPSGTLYYDEDDGHIRLANGSTPGGIIIVPDIVSGYGNLYVNDINSSNVVVRGNLTVQGTTTTINNITANNTQTFTGNLSVTGYATFSGNTTFNGTLVETGNLYVTGPATFTGNAGFPEILHPWVLILVSLISITILYIAHYPQLILTLEL